LLKTPYSYFPAIDGQQLNCH